MAFIAGTVLLGAAFSAQAVSRTLILLQENSGKTGLDDIPVVPPDVKAAVRQIVDQTVEGGEVEKFRRLAQGRYSNFIPLSDFRCTRAELLKALIKETGKGRVVDLVILGHGNKNQLSLHGREGLFGNDGRDQGNIRTMLQEARDTEGDPNFNFSLRLVYMCNCDSSTLNDDWRAIGAKVSVGAKLDNYLHEPMITFFWEDFVKNDKPVRQAAEDSFAKTAALYNSVPLLAAYMNFPSLETGLSPIQESQQIVVGNGNLIFKDECQLAVNEARTFRVRADRVHTFPGIHLVAGQSYSINASSSDRWSNNGRECNANGYAPGLLDVGRRYDSYNMMRLVGERFAHNRDEGFVSGSGFSVGTSRIFTAAGNGFLSLFANDARWAYEDNAGQITVTITRLR